MGIVSQFTLVYPCIVLSILANFILFSYKMYINFHKTIDKKKYPVYNK